MSLTFRSKLVVLDSINIAPVDSGITKKKYVSHISSFLTI